MTRDELHAYVTETLVSPSMWHIKAILHCLIDAEVFVSLACTYEDCLLPGIPMDFRALRTEKNRLVVDHIIPREFGGTDKLENLRPIHHSCNSSRAFKGRVRTPEETAKRTETIRNHPLEPCPFCGVEFKFLNKHLPCNGLSQKCGHDISERRARNDKTGAYRCKGCNRDGQRRRNDRIRGGPPPLTALAAGMCRKGHVLTGDSMYFRVRPPTKNGRKDRVEVICRICKQEYDMSKKKGGTVLSGAKMLDARL